MAIAVYGFTLVVPLASIERGLKGGVQSWLELVRDGLGERIWLDDRLVGISYYNPETASREWEGWHRSGFQSKSLNGFMAENELLAALVDSSLGLEVSGCDWLEFDPTFPCVWPRGQERGNVAVPSSLKNKLPLKSIGVMR